MQSQVHLIPLCQLGNGVTVYGFRYPGLLNCLSWCYLTIAKNVVIATQPKNDCGTSLTNTWSKAFFELVGVAFGSLESSAGRRHNAEHF